MRLRPPRGTLAPHTGPRLPDSGTSLIEVLVAITVIGTVMTALTSFFVTCVRVTREQGNQQVAARLAGDAADRVRALRGSAVTTGRDRTSSDAQWASPVPGVAAYLAGMRETWDPSASFPQGSAAPLPTTPRPATLGPLTFNQHWYVGSCWQPPAGGDCGPIQLAGYVAFFRVVVAVVWSDPRRCAAGCSYLTATLVSAAAGDPVFNAGPATPPVVTNPGDQLGEVSVPVGTQLVATAATPPLTWSAFGLPSGVGVDSGGLVSGTPTSAGSYPVTIRAIDAGRRASTATFTWTVHALPTPTSPGTQVSAPGSAVTLPIALTGGTAPYTWSVTRPGGWGATGLPPGLTIDQVTGTISGTLTAATGNYPVTVTVSDAFGRSGSTTFTWIVTANPLSATSPGLQTDRVGHPVAPPLTLAATGGTAPYTWSATNLPPGLDVGGNGKIQGKPEAAGIWLVLLTVSDATGARASTLFLWIVLP